ncbi:MAG: S46 family peptidase [Bacteroidales bacterium]|nr:S46 family peptidase [Bacteroidales bacterium]
MRVYKSVVTIAVFLLPLTGLAREGMWLPLLAENKTFTDMQAAGLKLSPEDIYSINEACLKDAIVLFGRGCTGGIISESGLLITNHHCGAGQIAGLSTVGSNYLLKGYWAKNSNEELQAKGLTVKILNKIEDITGAMLKDIPLALSYQERMVQIGNKILETETSIEDTSHFKASIESFYAGNEYYLFLYTEYTDIRLVGTPPESIASFGGDTDNWVWPRHSADFALFRIYTGPDGKPAQYAPENIPLKSTKNLTVSAKGVKEGSFTMLMGFPGRTFSYLYSGELEDIFNQLYPTRIKIRDGRLEIINRARLEDEKAYLLYAPEQSSISNSWKKWKGVLYGFNRFDVLEKRREYEKWLLAHAGPYKNQLSEIYETFESTYGALKPYSQAINYFNETVFNIKFFRLYTELVPILKNVQEEFADFDMLEERFSTLGDKYFANLQFETEKELSFFLLQKFGEIDESYRPALLKNYSTSEKAGNIFPSVYELSALTNPGKFNKAVKAALNGKTKAFTNDALFKLCNELAQIYTEELEYYYQYYLDEYQGTYSEYIPLISLIDTTRRLYPDANLTMRLAYGAVGGYSPHDAVRYRYQTYSDGLVQKSALGLEEYTLPDNYLNVLKAAESTPYADSTGRLPLCFIASNHTSGGNSGSPVLNSEGKMIGLNFDRTWESTMSDFYFDESICRNIAVDCRYILFIIDKYAGAGYLLDEMDIEW